MADLDTLRPEVKKALFDFDSWMSALEYDEGEFPRERFGAVRAELLRLAGEVVRLSKVESRETEQRLQMEDVELYLMDVSQPDDEDADWRDRMKSAIELLVQDCNYAVGQKNKAEAELAALKERIAVAPIIHAEKTWRGTLFMSLSQHDVDLLDGKRVRLVVEE